MSKQSEDVVRMWEEQKAMEQDSKKIQKLFTQMEKELVKAAKGKPKGKKKK
jgi:hypothetical protein